MATGLQRVFGAAALALALASGLGPAVAQSQLNEQELIQKLTPLTRSIRPVMKPGDTPAPVAGQGTKPGQAPMTAQPAAPVAPAPSVDLDIKFAFASDRLDPASYADLDVVGRVMNSPALRTYRFQVAGHTDAVGSARANQGLSERRARAVFRYLVDFAKVDPARLVAVGYGESRLADPRNPNSGVNRRVEVTTLVPMAALP